MKRYSMSVCEAYDTGACVEAEESETGEWVKYADLPQWQPIATAPKDGTWVMLRGGAISWQHVDEDDPCNPPCVVARWKDDGWEITDYDCGVCAVEYDDPTHWMEATK